MKIVHFLTLLLLGTTLSAADPETNLFKAKIANGHPSAGQEDTKIARLVAAILERSHYSQQKFDDSVSRTFLDRYLDALDPAHLIFIQADLQEFDRFKTSLDQLTMRTGDTSPAYTIFNRFLQRFDQQVAFVTNELATADFKFTGNDRYVFNRRELPRPKDLTEAKGLWRERLRYEFLQEKLNKKKPDEARSLILRRYARQWRMLHEFDNEEVLQIYLTALTHAYDPHSDYMSRASLENFSISMKLSLFGIGALLRSEDGYCIIQELMPGPASNSKKLKPNDKIIAVAQGTNEPVDVVDMKLNKVVELIRGPKGSEVRLTVIPVDATDPSERKIVSLTRAEIKLEDQEAKAKLIEFPTENGPARRIGIIDLPSFYADMENRKANRKSTTSDVAELLKKLKEEKVSGVILDLRRNGGGSLEEAISLTGLFIKEGPVVQVKDPDGKVFVDEDKDAAILYDGPLVVLTSRFSASASEILAGALQDYGRAVVVGDSSTHGKGTVQSLIGLAPIMGMKDRDALGALKITIRKFYRANGSSTQLRGVTPDVVLPSVNNHAEIGEASLPNALPWDTIPSAKFETVNVVPPLVGELRKRSTDRVAAEKDFRYIQDEIERFKKTKEEKSVSMNEEQRLQEKKEAQDRADARKKELKARPEPTYKTYELTLKNVREAGLPAPATRTNQVAVAGEKKKAPPADSTDEENDEELSDKDVPAVDVTMDETRRILLDLISLTRSNGKMTARK